MLHSKPAIEVSTQTVVHTSYSLDAAGFSLT